MAPLVRPFTSRGKTAKGSSWKIEQIAHIFLHRVSNCAVDFIRSGRFRHGRLQLEFRTA